LHISNIQNKQGIYFGVIYLEPLPIQEKCLSYYRLVPSLTMFVGMPTIASLSHKQMRISKVYTKTGDGGETSLVGGERVSKASARVDSYGEVDELNSIIGLARAYLKDSEIDEALSLIQNDLFTLGADLASPAEIQVPRISDEFISTLEELSDRFLKELAPLKEFILPGGGEAGAALHLARTVARRSERRVVALASAEEVNPLAIVYLNRLSDLLFILARLTNKRAGVSEKMTDFSKRNKKD
jgi:cob(I)alamin adenosyltransferase